jgi:cell division protein FtsW
MLNPTPPRRAMVPPSPYDRWLILLIVSILGFGLLMVASASITVSELQLHQPFYYFYRQAIFLILGIAIGSVVVQFEIAVWEKISGYLLIGVMLLLFLVLIPGIGHSVNGSMRWIGFGPAGMQVSEMAKFAVVVYLAGYLIRQHAEIKTRFMGFVKPMGILAIIAGLLIIEPDFGATVVIIITALGMMFLGGMRLRHFVLLFAFILVVMSVIAISEPYRVKRLTTFLDPWANPFGNGYQLTQSLMAFGRGGWFGVGLGKSIQKMFYLPESYTDFIFAVMAEELGLIGIMFVMVLFTLLVMRILAIGRQAQKLEHHFAGFVAYGFAFWIGIQFMVNVGVNSGILPTKGLTLPLMSYGGSSMLVTCIVFAILLRIDYENRMMLFGLRER